MVLSGNSSGKRSLLPFLGLDTYVHSMKGGDLRIRRVLIFRLITSCFDAEIIFPIRSLSPDHDGAILLGWRLRGFGMGCG